MCIRDSFWDPATQTVTITARSLSFASRAINGDKILELPMVNLLPVSYTHLDVYTSQGNGCTYNFCGQVSGN